ncbi:MAG: hypothetical protein GXO39_03080 [Thermotogae bacterium]|nr:hypothetical protein [Thermotogota bacterium]
MLEVDTPVLLLFITSFSISGNDKDYISMTPTWKKVIGNTGDRTTGPPGLYGKPTVLLPSATMVEQALAAVISPLQFPGAA